MLLGCVPPFFFFIYIRPKPDNRACDLVVRLVPHNGSLTPCFHVSVSFFFLTPFRLLMLNRRNYFVLPVISDKVSKSTASLRLCAVRGAAVYDSGGNISSCCCSEAWISVKGFYRQNVFWTFLSVSGCPSLKCTEEPESLYPFFVYSSACLSTIH